MVFRVVVTSEAQRDLREIQRYIARDSFWWRNVLFYYFAQKQKYLESTLK
jgi:plasmid stabilization system protein ParE